MASSAFYEALVETSLYAVYWWLVHGWLALDWAISGPWQTDDISASTDFSEENKANMLYVF